MTNKSIKNDVEVDRLIHVFGDYYLGYDSLNIIIYKKYFSKKHEKFLYREGGFFIGARALLHKLYDLYILEKIKDKTIAEPSILIGIENFVEKTEEIKRQFDKIKE